MAREGVVKRGRERDQAARYEREGPLPSSMFPRVLRQLGRLPTTEKGGERGRPVTAKQRRKRTRKEEGEVCQN
jgi:hypothetical protein